MENPESRIQNPETNIYHTLILHNHDHDRKVVPTDNDGGVSSQTLDVTVIVIPNKDETLNIKLLLL